MHCRHAASPRTAGVQRAGTMFALPSCMDYLFSAAGSQALDYAAVGRTLFAFDFDGLSEPSASTRAPKLPPELHTALHRLAQRARVAVISDHARAGLLAQLPPAVRYVVGHDGAPDLPDPPGGGAAPHAKAAALQALQTHSRCHALLFVGNARSDEPVFASAPPDWLTVHVGTGAPSQARYFVNDTNEVAALLHALLARMSDWPQAG